MTNLEPTCGAARCAEMAVTGWVNTLILTPRGHRQYPVCATHSDDLAEGRTVNLVRPSV